MRVVLQRVKKASVEVEGKIIGKIDDAIVDGPSEAVVLILVGTIFVVVNLSAYPIFGVCMVGDEADIGVVGVEGIGASPFNIGVVHAEVAPPFARERHRLVRVFHITA